MQKKNTDIASILFFNRMIYDRATIYRIAAPTDDCFVFTIVGKKKNIPKEDVSHISFVRTASPCYIFLYASTTTSRKKFFFPTRCSSRLHLYS